MRIPGLVHVAAALAAVAPAFVAAQAQPDPLDLLAQIGAAYRNATSGRFEGYTVRAPEGTAATSTARRPFGYAFEAPGRLRQESPGPPVPVMITDGRKTWVFRSDYQQYREFPGRAFGVPAIDRIRRADERVQRARFGGEAVLTTAGRPPTATWIVDVDYDPDPDPDAFGMRSTVRFWIDKGHPIVWQERSALGVSEAAPGSRPRSIETIVYTKVEFNADLPDDLFTFTPAPGTMQVERFQDPRSFDLTGRPAPDFTLRDLDGREFNLASQRGHVVLLDFWATWCLPCRRELPVLQKLHEDFASRDLVVVGITRGDEAEIRAFLDAHGITFPILTTDRDGIHEAYLVNGIPLGVIIDTQGNVSSYFPGLRFDEEWREGLAKVGIGN